MSDDEISLRDYIESRLKAIENATELAHKELERRLVELNKLREDVVTDRIQFLPRMQYDENEKIRSQWREVTSSRLSAIESRAVTWTTAIGVFFTVLQLLSGLALYFLLHR